MTNFGLNIASLPFESLEKSNKIFVTNSNIGINYAIKKVIRIKYIPSKDTGHLKGFIFSPELHKAWTFKATYSGKFIEIKTDEIDYHHSYPLTEESFESKEYITVGEVVIKPKLDSSLKSKTSELKRKLDELILKYEGIGVYYFITTGIDYNLKYFKSAIGTGDREYIENLIKSGKKVSIVVVSNYPQITSRVPLYIEYVPVEEYVSKHPSISSILKLKFSDLPD